MGDTEAADLQAKHRKERKELQAKIQALKKSAGKGDKKKVLEEIAKLEADLDRRQDEEVRLAEATASVQSLEVRETADEDCNANPVTDDKPQPRVSKAQKRRDKKANDEKERQAEILAQELLNVHGPRQQETDSIKAQLKARNLVLQLIPSDGDCLYNAVSHQLNQLRKPPLTVAELRSLAADYILANKDDLINYMTNAAGDCLNDTEFTAYVDAVRNTRAWGGQIEIQALSNCLRCPIEVIQSTGTITQGESFKGRPLILTYHRHMYSLGEHYNAARPLPAAEEDAQ